MLERKIDEIVNDWYMRGFNGAFPSGFGKGVFHSIDNVRKVGNANFMFYIDFGSADIDRALEALEYELEEYGLIPERTYPDSVHDTILLKKI